MPETTDPQPDRRERYEQAIRGAGDTAYGNRPFYEAITDAVIAVADAEQAKLRRERDLAIAHDRQPYPTAWAYEQACKALRQKTEAIERVRSVLESEAVVGRSALDYRGLITSALMADEAQQPETQAPFVTRVLELFSLSHADAYGDLFWRVDNGQVHLSANVSDVFAWGGADAEPITPETLPALEQAYADLKAIGSEEFTADLYAARQRGERPQGAAYPGDTHPAWREVSALFDACGPERPLGLGNPKAAPAHKEPTS